MNLCAFHQAQRGALGASMRARLTPQVVTTTIAIEDHSFLEVASAVIPVGYGCPPASQIQYGIGAPPLTQGREPPNTLCLYPSFSGRWQREQAAYFLYQNGFKDLAAKLGYVEGVGIINIGFFLPMSETTPGQRCWTAPITAAQADEIVAFVTPVPGLRTWLSPQIVVSGGQNKVLRFQTDPFGGNSTRVDAGVPMVPLICRGALGLPPRGTSTAQPEPEPRDPKAPPFKAVLVTAKYLNRFTANFTDSGIARIPDGLMRMQIVQANRCGTAANGETVARYDVGVMLIETSSDCGNTWSTSPIFPADVTVSNSKKSLKLSEGFDGSAIYYHAEADRVYIAARSDGKTVVLGAPARKMHRGGVPSGVARAQDYIWSTTLVFPPGDNNPSMTSVPTSGKDSGERLFLFCCAEEDGKKSPLLLIVENPVSFTGKSPTVHTVELAGLPVPATAQSGASTLPFSEIAGSKVPESPWNAVPLLSGRLINQLHLGSIVPLDYTVSAADGLQHKLRVLYPSVTGSYQVANVVDLVVQVQPNGVVVAGVLDHRVISGRADKLVNKRFWVPSPAGSPPNAHVLYAQLIPTDGLYGVADREFAFRHVLHWTEVEGKPTLSTSELTRPAAGGSRPVPAAPTPVRLYQGPAAAETLKPSSGATPVRPIQMAEPESAVRVLVDCWLPDPRQLPVPTGRWTGSQVLGRYSLNRRVLKEDLVWLGDYHFGTFVDAGEKTRFFVPWPMTTESAYYLQGSMITY